MDLVLWILDEIWDFGNYVSDDRRKSFHIEAVITFDNVEVEKEE